MVETVLVTGGTGFVGGWLHHRAYAARLCGALRPGRSSCLKRNRGADGRASATEPAKR